MWGGCWSSQASTRPRRRGESDGQGRGRAARARCRRAPARASRDDLQRRCAGWRVGGHGPRLRGQPVSPPPSSVFEAGKARTLIPPARDQGRRGRGFKADGPRRPGGCVAGRARFDGVNSGVGERTGDDVRVEHPDTKGAGDCEGCPRGVGALMCVANGRLRHMLIGLRPPLEDQGRTGPVRAFLGGVVGFGGSGSAPVSLADRGRRRNRGRTSPRGTRSVAARNHMSPRGDRSSKMTPID